MCELLVMLGRAVGTDEALTLERPNRGGTDEALTLETPSV
jgi:hypothetical protein